jgi:hypothetical protein
MRKSMRRLRMPISLFLTPDIPNLAKSDSWISECARWTATHCAYTSPSVTSSPCSTVSAMRIGSSTSMSISTAGQNLLSKSRMSARTAVAFSLSLAHSASFTVLVSASLLPMSAAAAAICELHRVFALAEIAFCLP